MSAEPFIDTNIWVYAHTEEPDDLRGRLARALVEDGRRFVISTQVLNEYYSAMLKNRVDEHIIQQNIEAMIQRCEVRLIDLSVIRSAHRLKLRYRFSYWDSLIIATARDAGCPILYSEDLQDGQQIEGTLRIVNPLATPGTSDFPNDRDPAVED